MAGQSSTPVGNGQQILELDIKGLYTNNNRYSQCPPGALVTANNIVVDKISIAETRRGQRQYGTQLTIGTGTIDQLLMYRNSLLVNYNGTLAYDSDDAGTWIDYDGEFTPPSVNGTATKMKNVTIQGNNYVTTNKGVFGQDSLTTNPTLAGLPPALSCSAGSTGTNGFCGTDTAYAYRICIGITDLNNNLKLGPPSNRGIFINADINFNISGQGTGVHAGTLTVDDSTGILVGDTMSQVENAFTAIVDSVPNGTTVVVNGSYAWSLDQPATAGHTCNANVAFIIPQNQGIGTKHFYQIYRSDPAANAASPPDDNCQLVTQTNFTEADLTAGTVSFLDTVPDSLKQAYLYTDQSQEGITATNNPPPLCTDMCQFDGYTLYANCTQKNTYQFTLVGLDLLSYESTTGDTNSGTAQIINIPDTSGLHVGMAISGTGIPADTYIATIDGSTQITMTKNATATNTTIDINFNDWIKIADTYYYAAGSNDFPNNKFFVDTTSASIDTNISNTSANLIAAINLAPGNDDVYGISLAGPGSAPGLIEIQEQLIAGPTFYVTSNQGSAFTPTLPSTGTSQASQNDARQNSIYISKYLQPEAVPIGNVIYVGIRDFPIERIVTLTTAVYVFKQDGIYMLVDQGGGNFALSITNNNALLLLPETAQTIDNQIMNYSTQGIVAVTNTGSEVLSFCIENLLLDLSTVGNFPYFYKSFGVTYESDRKFIFYTVSAPTDTYPTQAFVYNYITQTWTQWTTPRTCGLLLLRDQRLYTGHPTNGYVYQERKSLNSETNEDYADEDYPVTITSTSGTTVNVTSTTNVAAGMTLEQDYLRSIVVEVIDDTSFTVEDTYPWNTGAAAVYTPINVQIQFVPQDCANVGIMKKFNEATFVFLQAGFDKIDFISSTNFSRGDITTTLEVQSGLGWGQFPWGTQPWGVSTDQNEEIRTYIPMPNTQGLYLNIGLNLNEAFTNLSFEGVSLVYTPISTRFR